MGWGNNYTGEKIMLVSVGLPFFRSKYIGWLALESLCRQENIDFEWELVIIEELTEEFMGEEEINKYKDRLAAAGCKSLRYIGLDKWVPLSVKLKRLIGEFSNTEIAIWNPDDYYAPSGLLKKAKDALYGTDFEWFCIPKTIFYNIANGSTMLYEVNYKKRWDDSTGRAFKTKILKEATEHFDKRKHGCDGMVHVAYRKTLKREPKIFFDPSDEWKRGLNTKGLNNICLWQINEFKKIKSPFSKCVINIREFIPIDILTKLEECKKFLSNHKVGLRI